MTDAKAAPQRGKKQRERAERMRAAMVVPGIRVVPANDDMRRVLKHPKRGGFRHEGGMEWPDDRFTKRRLAEGVIQREDNKDGQQNKTHRHYSKTSAHGDDAA